MTLYSTELADYFAAHHSIVSTAALRRLQIKKAERERLLRAGVIEVVYEGVYRLCGAPTTLESRCAALCAADPKLTITCASSCRLAGLRGCTSDTIHAITSRRGLPIKIKGDDDVVIHRTTNLPKAHVVRRADGIRLTKTARAILDEARHREPLQLESLVEDGISKGKCTAQTLRAMVNEMAARGRRGTTRLTEVLRGRPTWRRPVGSNPELVLLKALADAGLELTRQPSLSLPDGRTIHPDGGDEEIRFFVEVDDHEWHGGRVRRTRDYVRDRQAGLGGAQVVRVGTDEIADRLDDVVAEVVGLHALRRRHVLGPDAA